MSEKSQSTNQIDAAYGYADSLGAGMATNYRDERIHLKVEGHPMAREIPVRIQRDIGEAGVHATTLKINERGFDHNSAQLTVIPDKGVKTPDGYTAGSSYRVRTNKKDWVGNASVFRKAANGETYEHTISTKTESGLALAKKIVEVSAREYKKAAKERAISLIEKDDR